MVFKGKGFFIWQIPRCEAGDVNAVANVASQAGLSHVLVKIADGTNKYNIFNNVDWVPPLIQALRERSIQVLGWHYVYGYEPLGEADIAIQRVRELGLDGYVIDAEAQYAQAGKDVQARQFMTRLRASLPDVPIVLSSYRFPTYHPLLPWQAFLEKCDYNMPQVYWIAAHNPADQLVRCLREFEAITPFRPIIPTGAAFQEGGWQPTPAEVTEFLRAAQDLNLTAANLYEWYNCRTYLPDVWDAVSSFPWPQDPSTLDIVQRYIAALNSHDLLRILELYNPNAVHVTAERTIQGLDAIRNWYEVLFSQTLPVAFFTLLDFTGTLGSRQFTWTAQSSAGNVNNGSDAFGLVGGKITYHYTHFTVTSN